MKKSKKILSTLLAGVLALGSMQFACITASASEGSSAKAGTTSIQYNVLFEEKFESGYESITSFDGKAGSWKVPAGVFGRNGTGEESEVNALRSKSGNLDFNFTEPYQDQMVLKVTVDFLAGTVANDTYMRIDVVGLNDVDDTYDSGRVSLCYLVNGKVYVNCIGATDARDTGATYTAGTRYILEGIIDQANETCTISIYEKATGTAVLTDYNIDPYKHDKSNYYKLTHGFTGVRFATARGNVSPAFDLHDIKVEEVEEVSITDDAFNVTLFEETFEAGYESITGFNGKAGTWKVPAGIFGRNGSGEESEVNALRNKSGNLDFNFTEPYQDQMVLKVTVDFLAGTVANDTYMRIDVVGLNDVDDTYDSGRVSLCYLVNGKVYVNCIGATDARDTGATYTAGTRYILEGIIDQANETCTISIYEKATGTAVLTDYNIDPYKHDKSNYYKLTHGFTGVRFATARGNVSPAFDLHDISVKTIGKEDSEEIPEGTFSEIAGVAVDGSAVTALSQISTGDKLTVTVDYTNSTGADKTLYLIFACYDDEDCLTNFSYVTKDVAGSVRTDEIEIESNEVNVAGADKMNIMVWDGFDTLNSLSAVKAID